MLQPRDKPPKWMLVVSVILGFILMFPLASFFDGKNWPVFNSWAMLHATVLIAWPLLALAVLVVTQAIRYILLSK